MGNHSGTAVPQVSGPASTGGYTPPPSWPNPAVSGRDLMVHRDVLRSVASDLADLADRLQGALGRWGGAAAQASSLSVMGSWPEARSLAAAVGRAHSGVSQFTGALRQAHSDMATRLTLSADKYDAAEQHITHLIHASNDPSATIVESGGTNVPVHPGYGQHWTPAQQEAYARTQRIEHMTNGAAIWQATFPITEDAAFVQSGTSGYTWQEVRSLLENTDPGAITEAGGAYNALSATLTDISGKLAAHGQQLAENWGGTTAVTAVSQIQQLYQTAADLQAHTASAHQSLIWYGPVLATFKACLPQPASTHAADAKAANQAAQQLMAALNGHIQTAYHQLPGAVHKNLPPPLAGSGGSGTAGGVGGGRAGGGSVPGLAGGPAAGTGGPAGAAGGPAGAAGGPAAAGGATASAPGGVPGAIPHSRVPGGSTPGAPGGATPGMPGGAPGTSGQPGAPGGQGAPAPTRLAGAFPGSGAAPGGAGTVPPGSPGPSGPSGPSGPVPGGSGGVVPGAGVLPGPGSGGGVGPRREKDPLPEDDSVPGGMGGVPGGPLPGGGVPGASGPSPGELAGLGEPPPVISPAGLITAQAVPGPSANDLAAPADAAAGEAGGGPGMFPMMGGMPGGAGQFGAGRNRESWTSEDEDTWGPEATAPGSAADDAVTAADGTVPGMIPVGATRGQSRDRDRPRQSWLAEEDDLWGAGQPAVPPVISQG